MSTVKQNAIEIMQHFVDIGMPYGWNGAGHDRSEWTNAVTLSDGTVAYYPSSTDCSGAVICAYENADPGCTGYAYDTGSLVDGCLSTGKWVYHNTSGGEYYVAQPGDLYVYSKAIHGDGHTAMCCTAVPDMLIELVYAGAQKVAFHEFGSGWDGTLEYVGSGGGSVTIAEDGYWGTETTKAFQRHYGLTVDGLVQHQSSAFVQANPNLTSGWQCDSTGLGSPVIRAIQQNFGITSSGVMNVETVQIIKELFDGIYGRSNTLDGATIWEIQHQLNGGIWPYHLWKS